MRTSFVAAFSIASRHTFAWAPVLELGLARATYRPARTTSVLTRHMKNVALLTPCLCSAAVRQRASPASVSFRMATIWVSLNFDLRF